MGLKGILKECFVEGVNQFFDSALNKIEQETDRILEESSRRIIEEELSIHEMMLERARSILINIGGADGTFDEDLKSKEDIWNRSMAFALLLSGRSVEELDIMQIDGNVAKDIDIWQTQWEETVEFMDSDFQEFVEDLEDESFISDISLAYASDKFCEEILQLQNFKGGLFAARKLKKEISCCSQCFASVCTSCIQNIRAVKEYLNDDSI